MGNRGRTGPCRIAGCGQRKWAHGLCRAHYDKSRRNPWALVTWDAEMNMAARFFGSRAAAIRAAPADQPASVVNIATKPAVPLPDINELIQRTRPIGNYRDSTWKTHAQVPGLWSPAPRPPPVSPSATPAAENGRPGVVACATPAPAANGKSPRLCEVAGCGNKHHAAGLCVAHYSAARRADPHPPRIRPGARQRFLASIERTPGGCWLWTRAITDGYAVFWCDRRLHLAHDWAFEEWFADIPPGYRLARRPSCPRHCVNPSHWLPKTPTDITRDSKKPRRGSAAENGCRPGKTTGDPAGPAHSVARPCDSRIDPSKKSSNNSSNVTEMALR